MNTSLNTQRAKEQPNAQVGQPAPDFTLLSQEGQPITLSQYREKQNVVLFFYPKDFTPGCTQEVCQFRDSYHDFVDQGAIVLGISADPLTAHQRFVQTHQLPFHLLSDPKNEVRKSYQVPKTLGLLPGRVTYVIDKQGVIRHIFNSQLNIQGHVRKALAVLEGLA